MISLESKTKHNSAVLDGVTFHTRKYSEGLKMKLSQEVSSIARQLVEVANEIREQGAPYRAEYAAAPDDAKPAPPLFLVELLQRKELLDRQIDHVWVKLGFIKAEGIEIDGQPITADLLINEVPSDSGFYEEVRDAIKVDFGLSPEKKTSSESPGTIGNPADGNNQSSTAATASVTAYTEPATAESTSQTK